MARRFVRGVLDSNIIIDLLSGRIEANDEASRYSWLGLSRITWIEVLVGTRSSKDRHRTEDLLRQFSIVELDERVAREAVELRRKRHLKLPDAIIWASALLCDALLVTRNTKDFPASEPRIRVPYRL